MSNSESTGSSLTPAQTFLNDLWEEHVRDEFAIRGHVIHVGIVHHRGQSRLRVMAHEHIYWDQASVLVQLGLLDPSGLPVAGVETARKVMDPSRPSNELIQRTEANQR